MPEHAVGQRRGHGLTPRQARLVKILADPSQSGRTSTDIAKEIGVKPRTVRDWWAKPEIKEAVDKLIWQYAGRHLPYAWECLVKRMKDDTKAIQLYFTLLGQYKEKYELTGPDGGPLRLAVLAAYSEQDLEKLKRELKS